MKAYINGISYYLPKKVLTNNELSVLYPEWSVNKISKKTGIESRHISDENEYASDMAVSALNNLINDYEIDKSLIDYLIVCTQSPDYALPTTACIVQNVSKLPKTCGAVDINLGCSGYIYGLGLAKGLIVSGQAKKVILITSETYSKLLHPKDKSSRTIFGDASSATLITSEPNYKYPTALIKNFSYGSDGSGHEHLIVKNSGINHKKTKSKDVLDDDDKFVCNDDYLFMNGSEIFNFTAFEVPKLVKKTLKENGLNDNDISKVVFHQANAYMLDFIRKRCGIKKEIFFISLKDIGNTVSSTIPIAYARMTKETKLEKDDNILLVGFGVGLSMGGVVLKYV
jgi:3-oxoacyl-[acyl-carrier-protein] synthase III